MGNMFRATRYRRHDLSGYSVIAVIAGNISQAKSIVYWETTVGTAIAD